MNSAVESFGGLTALVTGSTTGLGLKIAETLASRGAGVAINGMGDSETINRALARINKTADTRVGYFKADVSVEAEVETLVRDVEAQFGKIDILVNCAGIQYVSSVHEFPVHEWRRVIDVNLTASFITSKLTLPQMRRRNWGRIINISSTSGLIGVANKSAYVASKHGLIGLTKTIAIENAKTGVTCNAVCPSWVMTDRVHNLIKEQSEQEKRSYEEVKSEWIRKTPSGNFATEEQVSAVVAFLCTSAADEIRGAAWTIDGGYTAV